jgi:alpha-galactosidase
MIRKSPQEFVLAKPLDDGSIAVGMFNLTKTPLMMTMSWKGLARSGNLRVRDVWHQIDIGEFLMDSHLNYSSTA